MTASALARRLALCALLPALAGATFGCNDVGDDTGLGPAAPLDAAGLDGTVGEGGSDDGGQDGAGDDADGTTEDATPDAGAGDEAAQGTEDSAADAPGQIEIESAPEAGVDAPSSGDLDATVPPEAAPDGGAPEAGPPDGSTGGDASDAGADSSLGPDGGNDAASDAESGDAASACTTTPCAAGGPNSLLCAGNHAGSGVCTPTEAVFVNADPTLGCYTCLEQNFCLDNAHQVGFECGDLSGSFTNGAGGSVEASGACLATLSCDVGPAGQNCPNDTNGISDCYCGSGGGASTLCASSTAQNGPCLASELAGFAYTPGSMAATKILGEFTTQTQPSGNANALAACAQENCPQCFP